MPRIASLALPVLVVLLSLAFPIRTLHAEPDDAAQGTPDGYIVVLKSAAGNPQAAADDMARRHGLAASHVYEHALKGFAATVPAQALAGVRRDPRVQFVSEDRVVQTADMPPLAPGDSAPTGTRRIVAATTTSVHHASTVAVAVIDTGIDLKHPDLNAVNGKSCVKGRTATDDHGHGTHVAGTIAARNNGAGVVGVAPGTTVYAVKVLNSRGSGTWSQVICGIDWVTGNAAALNIKVANMSLGGFGSNDNNCGNTNSDALHQAICNSTASGMTYVVAAGNNTIDLASFTPAAYPEVLAVAAMSDSDGASGGKGGAPTCRSGETDDGFASFSNFAVATAEINHTIAGPGVCIYSTAPSGGCSLCDPSGYKTLSGTSMATPHVAGTAALCLGNGTPGPCAGLSPAQIIQKLRADAASYAGSNPGYGFTGDPNASGGGRRNNGAGSTRYYGYLVWDGGY